jgi:hypothetical protein
MKTAFVTSDHAASANLRAVIKISSGISEKRAVGISQMNGLQQDCRPQF